ncbi:protein-methionine-sulfoxide reductase catalytic subunit MsrP [Rhodoplanes serenus]|uniref:Protein-methionine-sulfoxide reductase catalytic subunit MsrP n=1 Tax=Rhodoplanes serenus TaxID=200615 RepID=A0A327KDM0_9BRAD|nr:protein-methionine-sulfoxide reductase catalytic subunit MsrP [Rhodoplanes serenus]MTW15061.1 protein-methionine-sulfoxide reductase catalytic subunit MsrP [Rhodoplanes serenus]RAI36251.1 mononuclear molybdenum enzyme YedY [Rhodoplanes serenus]
MPVIRRRPWALPDSAATPEAVFLDRRRLLAGGAALAAGAFLPTAAPAQRIGDVPDPSAGLYPARRNPAYALDRPVTDEAVNLNYNNFYEFGPSKSIARAAQALKTRPWTVAIDGMVETPFEIGIDDLLKRVTLEERLYRHRCVEAWSMAIPWTGFPMAALVALAKPLGSAKYVRMETFKDPTVAPGQRQVWYPWPYVEGLTIAEATNELAFLVTGAYGKPVAKQMGAPLRLAVPWKYGFKSIKSIVRFTFTDQRPRSYWEALQASEYGFWANVNPQVPHPRWSQASERVLGTDERRPTLLFNGYGDQVAHLYQGLDGERLWA